MADGKGCKCAAYDESECACDADWTPQELIDARAEIARLRLTDAERQAVKYVCRNVLPDGSREGDDALHLLRMLLKRTQ